jgi:hypothetical protein
MQNKRIVPIVVMVLVSLLSVLPVQITLCQAAEVAKKVETEKAKESAEPKDAAETDDEADTPLLSTGMKIGIGVGAAVLLGGAMALGGGGGGDSAPAVPPTADQLVSAWHAEANQPGSGLTYTGTYHLYQGGGLGYDIFISNGQHLVGGGAWRIEEYNLSLHTDHGSLYRGTFAPDNISSVSLNSNTGWVLTLTR